MTDEELQAIQEKNEAQKAARQARRQIDFRLGGGKLSLSVPLADHDGRIADNDELRHRLTVFLFEWLNNEQRFQEADNVYATMKHTGHEMDPQRGERDTQEATSDRPKLHPGHSIK